MADQLTETQIAELKEVFNLFDKDEDGYLKAKELSKILTKLGQPPSDEQIALFTKESQGRIDFPDFLALMAAKMKDTDTEEDLTEVFRMFDRDTSDHVTPEEFRYIVKCCGEEISLQDAKVMFNQARTRLGVEVAGRDDGLGYDDFIRMMMDTNT